LQQIQANTYLTDGRSFRCGSRDSVLDLFSFHAMFDP